jgi:hypothetical protein
LCPHRGIDFLGEGNRPSSDTGEIIIDLPRSGLAPEIVSKLPTAEQNKDTFPSNNDPMTFGLFFGHIRPMEPAEHVNQSIPIEVHIMFYY